MFRLNKSKKLRSMDPSLLPVRTRTQEFSIVEDQLHLVRLRYEQQHLSTNTYTTLKGGTVY